MRFALFAPAIAVLVAASAADAASLPDRTAACAPLPQGPGPKPAVDSPSSFLALPAFSKAATSASTPKGYVKQYSNLLAANTIVTAYLGVASLKSYDVDLCAAKCNAIKGCASINIYFERSPSLEPGSGTSGCANPCSTTNIKCAFFGTPVTASSATNQGQWRNKFQVVIAGSNGYTNALALVNQARAEIGQPSNLAQPYCSSILGYTTPTTTVTVFTTSTPRATLISTTTETDLSTTTRIDITTQFISVTSFTTSTITQPTTTTDIELSSSTTTISIPTTTVTFQTITSTVTASSPKIVIVRTTVYLNQRDIVPTERIDDSAASPTAAADFSAQRRAISLPSVLSKYPASIVSCACSAAVSPATQTRTATILRTSTASTVFTTQITPTTTASTATAVTSSTSDVTSSIISTDIATTTPIVTATSTTTSIQTITEAPVITATSSIGETVTVSTTTTRIQTVLVIS